MKSFEEQFQSTIKNSKIEKPLLIQPLKKPLHELFEAIHSTQMDLSTIKIKLEQLFVFLSSEEGRTDTNCRFTGLFFCLQETWPFDELPDEYREIFFDIGAQLDDTFTSPDIAKNFYSLPEQLLARIQKL